MNKRFYARSAGFTLIELMIVVVIIAILTAIAYPSYLDSVRKARRADAQADLVELASFMERSFTENSNYTTAVLPFTQSPRTNTAFYQIDFNPARTATSYTLRSIPQGDQTNDPCGTMTLTNTGQTGAALGDCWQ